MFKHKALKLLITLLLTPTSLYAHDPEGMARVIGTAFIIALFSAAVFLKFLKKYISIKTNLENKLSTSVWLVITFLIFLSSTLLFSLPAIYLSGFLVIYYDSEFYLKYGFALSLIIGTIFLFLITKFL